MYATFERVTTHRGAPAHAAIRGQGGERAPPTRTGVGSVVHGAATNMKISLATLDLDGLEVSRLSCVILQTRSR